PLRPNGREPADPHTRRAQAPEPFPDRSVPARAARRRPGSARAAGGSVRLPWSGAPVPAGPPKAAGRIAQIPRLAVAVRGRAPAHPSPAVVAAHARAPVLRQAARTFSGAPPAIPSAHPL